MAASIRDKLGIEASLKEGHGGLFEVAAGDKVLFTNNRKCGNLPKDQDVVRMIKEHGTGK
ncbi:MAG: hypothetical protein HYX90_00840 [Chloroflexi bacterium]|nr:hypothetical protein [Chloroflexota bacterium]